MTTCRATPPSETANRPALGVSRRPGVKLVLSVGYDRHMSDHLLKSLDDPRVDLYRELKRKSSAPARTFIAEGEKLVLRLFDSPCRTESILCTPAARERLPERLPADLPIYIAPTPLISKLIGFQFHRGMLACGVRPQDRTIGSLCDIAAIQEQALVVLCPEIRDPENLGTIVRTAAAFGATGLVAGREGTDPFSRRVLRTSMGSVLQLPIVQTDDWPLVLDTLHAAGFESIATVLDPSAEVLGTSPAITVVDDAASVGGVCAGLQSSTPTAYEQPGCFAQHPAHDGTPSVGADTGSIRTGGHTALLFGNEDAGLSPEIVGRCRRRVTLPMAAGVNSLNVAVAAGIVLHHFRIR